jgi:HK97 family phage portal protein
MNLLARIKAAFTAERWLRSTMTIVQGSGDAKRQPFSYPVAVRNYASWIYAASTINAIAVASQPLRLYVRNRSAGTKLWNTRRPDRRMKAYLAGDSAQHPSRTVIRKVAEYGSEYEEVTDAHPLLELLSKVNPYQNGFDATVLRVLYGELTGNAYVHPVIDQRLGRPVELWTMPSQYVQVVPGEEVFIEGYLYGASVEQRKLFEPDEVIHFRRPNPNDLYYGMGKVEAAWGAAMQNAAIHEMDLSFFENKARPDYLLTVKGDASPEELERFQAMIESKMQGKSRTGKFLAATADIDVKPLAFPPKDLAGRSDIVEEIAAVFGVPVSMLKANDPNLASATTGYAMWRETTILPLLRMDEETLNQNLVPLFGIEDDAFLAYDNPVKGDERFEFEKRRGLVAGGIITANEARALEGMEPIDDPMADRLLVNGQPLGGPAPAPALFSADPIQRPDPASVDGLVGGMDPKPEEPAETGEVSEQPETKSVIRPEMKDALGDCVSDKIPKLIDEGYPQDQAVAIAYSMCSEGKSIEAAIRSLAKAVEDVDTKPPQAVADNARRALEVRETKPESERGMTAVGIARARDLMNRESLSEDTIRRMVAYFERHEVDKQGSTWEEQGKGWQAWNGWGGDEGFAWAKRKVEEFDRARGEKRKGCGCCATRKAVSHRDLWEARHEILTKASERDAARENREINSNEDEIAGAVNRVFDRQVDAVIRKLEASPLPTRELIAEVEQILRARRWNAGIVTALRPYIETALVSGISIGQETLSKVAANPVSFEPQNENLRAYARAESVRLADRAAGTVNAYTAVKVTEILGQGVADGETIPQLAERVRTWAGEKGDEERGTVARARTIARTEAQRASRSAEVEAWKASGIVEGKTWLLAPDPCEFCEAASNAFSKDGVGIDQAFYAKGQALEGADGGTLNLDYEDVQGPPLHPNCRCSLQPKLVSDYESIIAEAEKELEQSLEENR